MAGLNKIRSGQRYQPSATHHNETVDLLIAARQGRLNETPPPAPPPPDRAVIKIRNVSGGDLPRLSIVGLGDPVIDPDDDEINFLGEIIMDGQMPSIEAHLGRFAVVFDAIPDGAVGRAVVSGAVITRVIAADGETMCDIKDNDTEVLLGGGGSAAILWMEPVLDDATPRLAIVRLGGGGGETRTRGVITDATLIGGSDDRYHYTVQIKQAIDGNGQYITDGDLLTNVLNEAELDNNATHFNNGQKRTLTNGGVLEPEPVAGSVMLWAVGAQWYFDKPMPTDVDCGA